MHVIYPVPLVDVEMRLGRAVCVAPEQSVSTSPSHRAAVVLDDHLGARRCRSPGDVAEAVRHVQGYVVLQAFWMSTGRIGALSARCSPADGAPARHDVCAIAQRIVVAWHAPARRCAGRMRTGSSWPAVAIRRRRRFRRRRADPLRARSRSDGSSEPSVWIPCHRWECCIDAACGRHPSPCSLRPIRRRRVFSRDRRRLCATAPVLQQRESGMRCTSLSLSAILWNELTHTLSPPYFFQYVQQDWQRRYCMCDGPQAYHCGLWTIWQLSHGFPPTPTISIPELSPTMLPLLLPFKTLVGFPLLLLLLLPRGTIVAVEGAVVDVGVLL